MLACSSDVAMQTLMIKTLRDNRKDYLELDDTHLFVDPTCVALLRQALDQLHAVQLGHEQIAQHQVVGLLLQQAQGMRAVLSGFHMRDAGLEKQVFQVLALQ